MLLCDNELLRLIIIALFCICRIDTRHRNYIGFILARNRCNYTVEMTGTVYLHMYLCTASRFILLLACYIVTILRVSLID